MRTNRRERAVLSEINVTPFVDVMLVLLIIFMVTAPLIKQGIDVELPPASGKELPPEERLDIVVKKDGTIYLNKTKMPLDKLRVKLKAVAKRNPNVFLKADRRVSYGTVVGIIGEIKEAGIEKLGIVTEPKIRGRR